MILPIRIGPVVEAIFGIVCVALVWWLFEKVGDAREAKVRADYETKLNELAQQSAQQTDDAITARAKATVPGSVARLRANWCRDCGGKP